MAAAAIPITTSTAFNVCIYIYMIYTYILDMLGLAIWPSLRFPCCLGTNPLHPACYGSVAAKTHTTPRSVKEGMIHKTCRKPEKPLKIPGKTVDLSNFKICYYVALNHPKPRTKKWQRTLKSKKSSACAAGLPIADIFQQHQSARCTSLPSLWIAETGDFMALPTTPFKTSPTRNKGRIRP